VNGFSKREEVSRKSGRGKNKFSLTFSQVGSEGDTPQGRGTGREKGGYVGIRKRKKMEGKDLAPSIGVREKGGESDPAKECPKSGKERSEEWKARVTTDAE